MEYHLAKRKKEIQPFATTRKELVGIVLREISQTEKDEHCVESKKGELMKSRGEWCLPGAGGGSQVDGGTGKMFKGANLQLVNKFWRSNTQQVIIINNAIL